MTRFVLPRALFLVVAAFGAATGQRSARFDGPRAPVLTDDVVPIAISGLTRGHPAGRSHRSIDTRR